MKKILICSPEEGIREAIKLILADHFELILTDSQEMCSGLIQKADVRLVLLDVSQQKDSVPFIKKLKSEKPSLKIVVLVTSGLKDFSQKAVKGEADGYILRPFKSDELLAICK